MNTLQKSNFGGLLRSMVVIGSAQSLNILIAVCRMKAVAIILGPSGVGLLSIYNALQSMVATAAGLGMNASGVREIAQTRDSPNRLNSVKLTLILGLSAQGLIAFIGLWLLKGTVSAWLISDASRSIEIGLVGIAVFLTLLSSAYLAILQGFQRVDSIGQITVIGALASTAGGVLAIWAWKEAGIICFIILQPLCTYLISRFLFGRLFRSGVYAVSLRGSWETWKTLAGLGAGFMLGALATTATLLVVHGYVSQELGLEAAGYFAAARLITVTCIGFLLSAMAADFYPRLAQSLDDTEKSSRLINDQIQLSISVCGPALLFLVGYAPILISLLYSSQFGPAVMLLQWQTLGNIFKLAAWPLSYAIIAAGRARRYVFLELTFNTVFALIVLIFLPFFGLIVTAIAFVVGYMLYLLIAHYLAKTTCNFRWHSLTLLLLGGNLATSLALLVIAVISPISGLIAAPILAVVSATISLRIVLAKIGPSGGLWSRLNRAFELIGWPLETIR